MPVADAVAPTLSSILTDVGTVFTALIGYVGTVCTTIVNTPVLLISFCLGIGFVIVRFVKAMF